MPIYEYRCSDCDREFEKIVFGGDSSAECPDCRGRRTEKLISSFAVSTEARQSQAASEAGPCHCGAPQRGMCQMD